MGFFYNDHIQKFCEYKTIKKIEYDIDGRIFIKFTNGESLRLIPDIEERKGSCECGCKIKVPVIITTPLDKNNKIIQSVKIMGEE